MTGKRFTVEEWDIWDYADSILVIFQDGEFISNKDVVGLLNEMVTKCSKLEKENGQLRTKNNAYLQDIEMFKEENTILKLANEELKQENQELHKLNQEYINILSDEKKETISEILNAVLRDDKE